MTEEEIKQNLEENERKTIEYICGALNTYGFSVRLYLADFIASLCNVEKEKMFSTCNNLDVAQARWLFWYAYRYMTNETYEKIGKLSGELYGKTFTKVGVAASVNKMYELIENGGIWRKRWLIVKRIIKFSNTLIEEQENQPIRIVVPKDANVELIKQ
jgi:hypothetical protein